MSQRPDGSVNSIAGMDRRRMLQVAASAAGAAIFYPSLGRAQTKAWSEWGWPMPYQQVSKSSVDWLKTKGWWPFKIAWNPLWSDGNVLLFTMLHYKLLEARGLEVSWSELLTAGLTNEAFVPGRIQLGQGGSLGLLRLIDLKVPTAAVASFPAQRQAFMVPPDSPLKNGLIELKGASVLKRPAIVGVTIGSTPHLGLLIAAKVLGLQEGRDFVIKNLGPGDIVTMPRGVDVVGIWEPNVLLMTEFRKNARILELVDRYQIFNGYSWARGELEEGAPDVLQAYADAMVEARLIARLKPEEVLAAFVAHPSQRGRDPQLVRRDMEIHILGPKPTLNYPHESAEGFWIQLESFQANVMADAGVLTRRYSEAEFKAVLRPRYLANTYEKLGWNVPARPSFLPVGWGGKAGAPPYPAYGLMHNGRQEFPAGGDLKREWQFAGKIFKPR